MTVALLTFAAAAALIVLLPGPDTLVVVRALVRGGRRHGAWTALGVLTGLAVWVLAAALGLSAMLRASRIGYDVLRGVGAAYLVWLGVQSLRSRGTTDEIAEPRRALLRSGYVAGVATDLLNPKVGVFFVTFLPGFVPRGVDVAVGAVSCGLVFIAETALYFLGLLALGGIVVGWMTRAKTRRRLDRACGAVFIGFGLRLVTET